MIRALLGRHLRHQAGLLAALLVGLAGFEVLIVWAAGRIDESFGLRRLVEQLVPPMAREALSDRLRLLSFGGAVAFGFEHPGALVATIAFIVVAATIPSAERESGIADLVLARPVPRSRYLAAVLALMVIGALALPCALLAGTAIGLALARPADSTVVWSDYRPAAIGLAALLLSLGGLAAAIGAGYRRRGPAIARTVGVVLSLYFLEVLSNVWGPLDRIRVMSPFHWFDPVNASLGGGIPTRALTVLLAVFVAGSALALFRFHRQDL